MEKECETACEAVGREKVYMPHNEQDLVLAKVQSSE